MNQIKYIIINELNLIIEYYSGSISMEDMIQLKKETTEQRTYSPNFDVIMDFRDSTLNIEVAGLSKYVDFANTFDKIVGKRRTGFITSKPNEVVLTTMFGFIKGDLPIDSQTFSTLEALWIWLDKPINQYEIVKQKLEQLRN